MLNRLYRFIRFPPEESLFIGIALIDTFSSIAAHLSGRLEEDVAETLRHWGRWKGVAAEMESVEATVYWELNGDVGKLI